MTKDELMEWIKSADYITSDSEGYDENGNLDEERIYEKDLTFYKIHFMNNHPSEVWGVKGYIRGEYQPVKVKRIERQIIQVTWEEVQKIP